MNRSPLPLRLVHRGRVVAAGYLIDPALSGDRGARRRLLALWSPGARVFRLAGEWLIVLARPEAALCDEAEGVPLVVRAVAGGEALLGAPATGRELAGLDPAPGEVLWPRGGRWLRRPGLAGGGEDLAGWLRVDSFECAPVVSLGDAPAVPQVIEQEALDLDLRKRLGGVPAADARTAEVAAALAAHGRAGRSGRGGAPRSLRSGELLLLLRDLLVGAWRALARSYRRGEGAARRRGRRQAGSGRSEGGAQRPAKLHAWLSRVVHATPLARVVGYRYAAYVRRMMAMFEDGDFEAALRHAIPLGSGLSDESLPLSLSAPGPRSELRIRPGGTAATSLAPLPIYEEMRRLYRQAFERLVAQGKFEQAAFLLAELLQAHEEAVAFLEKHGQLRLAAELAEGRKLAPGLVVRQWFVAGEVARAVGIARREGAFSDVVARLERGGKTEEAKSFRLLWAADRAEAGDYAAAVTIAWQLPEAAALTREWVDRGIAQGGEVAARLLARKIERWPEPFEPLREEILELTESRGIERVAARLAFVKALLEGANSPAARLLARPAVRAMLRDGALDTPYRLKPADLRRVVDRTGDGALRTDVLHLRQPSRSPRPTEAATREVRVDAWDVGSTAVQDAVHLPSGSVAVALGEGGVRLIGAAGRTLAELDQPAYRLVVSDLGDRAIALAPRGATWRLSRLDFARRRTEPWTDGRLTAWADGYDGTFWLVAGPDGLVAIEVAGSRLDGPWGTAGLPGPVVSIVRSEKSASLLAMAKEPEVRTYQLPSFTLRERRPLHLRERFDRVVLSPSGRILACTMINDGSGEVGINVELPTGVLVRLPASDALALRDPEVLSEGWASIAWETEKGLKIALVSIPDHSPRASFHLLGVDAATVRLRGSIVTVSDRLGRLLVFDLEHGVLLRNLRI